MTLIMLIKFLILAIVQGLTEPLPISSSGHLVIFGHLLGINLDGNVFLAFAAFINFGSTLAIIIWFWNDIKWLFFGGIKYITSGFKKSTESKYLWNIFYSTLPLVFVTIILALLGIEIPDDSVIVVGIALLVTGLLLLLVSKKNGKLSVYKMTKFAAIIVGIAEAIALLPGISRSGITMVALLVLGFNKEDAFKYSFIMFIPASFGALIYSFIAMVTLHVTSPYIIVTLILSIIFSFMFTLIGLKIIKKIVIGAKLQYFAIYCFIVSLTIFVIYIF